MSIILKLIIAAAIGLAGFGLGYLKAEADAESEYNKFGSDDPSDG